MLQPPASLDELPLSRSANSTLLEFKKLAGIEAPHLNGAQLLYERSYMHSVARDTFPLAESSCRLVKCRDAILAVNLPRESDWDLIPAWLGPWSDPTETSPDDWRSLILRCREIKGLDLLEQAHQLGLAVSRVDQVPLTRQNPWQLRQLSISDIKPEPGRSKAPLVVDLSSLWAGPLCSHLLWQAGCRVIKVEGLNRLDGARNGLPAFYQLLNQGKESLVIDFKSEGELARLRQLLCHADVVIEGSRPRALQNCGIHAEEILSSNKTKVWLSITAYGRDGAEANRVGYGDDAAAAAGLSQIMQEATGQFSIAGDAIADPLTGMYGALAVWTSLQSKGSDLISIALRDSVGTALQQELKQDRARVLYGCRNWSATLEQLHRFFPQGPRIATSYTAQAGEHNTSIYDELAALTRPVSQQHGP